MPRRLTAPAVGRRTPLRLRNLHDPCELLRDARRFLGTARRSYNRLVAWLNGRGFIV
jgi:hypothetical protein